jgi:hypothetical protein
MNEEPSALTRLQLSVYLAPIIGFFPALWTLYRRDGTPAHKATSRLSVTLALCWLSGYILLETGARSAEFATLPLLIVSSAFTSSYFIVCVGLMVRLWQRQPMWLPGISRLGDRLP